MNILFTVCGRAGSKGIRNKNCRNFLGKPIIYRTLAVMQQYIDNHPEHNIDCVLSTDSQELIEQVEGQDYIEIDIINRDASLSGDFVAKKDVITDCMMQMMLRKEIQYHMVVDFDITSPLRTVQNVEQLIEKKEKANTDVVFSVTAARRNPYFNMVKKTVDGYKRVIESNFNARQEAPEIFDMNASLYAYDPRFLKEKKNIFDGKCDAILMMDTGILDLDREEDFKLMEVIADYLDRQELNN